MNEIVIKLYVFHDDLYKKSAQLSGENGALIVCRSS